MPTGATDLGFDVVAQQPRTELNYRVFVDTSGTEASLASIHAEQQQGGGGRLAFSTDSADGPLAQRMLIDNQGSVGIGTDEPNARLHVAGDAKFNGPLNVEGALTVSGVVTIGKDLSVTGPLNVQGALTASSLNVSGIAKVGGNLSVTGTLAANSFKGNGAGLTNLTLADGSVTNKKLASDGASLSKVSGGKMVVQGDSVVIGGRLEVNGAVKFQGSGSTTPGSTNWQPYPGNTGVYLDVDTSAGKFTTTPKYFASLGGISHHWATTGVTSIYTPSPTGFRVYVRWSDGSALTPAQANSLQWHVNWLGVEA